MKFQQASERNSIKRCLLSLHTSLGKTRLEFRSKNSDINERFREIHMESSFLLPSLVYRNGIQYNLVRFA